MESIFQKESVPSVVKMSESLPGDLGELAFGLKIALVPSGLRYLTVLAGPAAFPLTI